MTKKKTEPPPIGLERRKPTEQEQRRIDAAAAWMRTTIERRPQHPRVAAERSEATARIGPEHDDRSGWFAELAQVLGVPSFDLAGVFLVQATELPTDKAAADQTIFEREINAALAFVEDIEPQGAVEAALALQMYATHRVAMDMSQRTLKADTLERMTAFGSLLTKTQRTFAAQAEALAKLRSRGKQTVEVIHVHKHVYVAPGGQAIVGDVHHGDGRGVLERNRDQSHAPLPGHAVAGGLPLRSDDAGGDALPVTSGAGAEAMQDARREEPRRTHGRRQRPLSQRDVHPGGDGSARLREPARTGQQERAQ